MLITCGTVQDWVGQRKTLIGSQLWWNWEVDSQRYWGWKELIEDLRSQDIKVMTYCNPCLAPVMLPLNHFKYKYCSPELVSSINCILSLVEVIHVWSLALLS